MTQEDKELLLKDLSARLSYGVMINIPDIYISTKINIEVLNEIFRGDDGNYRCNASGILIDYCKPYLFPLSSMTEEQKRESPFESSLLNAFINRYISLFDDEELTADDIVGILDWFNKNHFDYRGLIEKGLAIDCTDLNIY